MPYSGASDESLPDNVKKLPDPKKAQWVAVFNSAYKTCIKGGGDAKECESASFAQAWGVVNKDEEGDGEKGGNEEKKDSRLYPEQIKAGLAMLQASFDREQNAVPLANIFEPIWQAVAEADNQAWLTDIYADAGNALFAIIAAGGKLYRAAITISENAIALGEWQVIDHSTMATRSTLFEQPDGKTRWLSVSCSSVLNRNAQIDSRELFDTLVENFYRGLAAGEQPIRMFCHSGPEFKTGIVDFVARDDYLLITSGVFDDSELARAEIAARSRDEQGFWGESIGFQSSMPPDEWEVAPGVLIPVYRQGVLQEVSTVPEEWAAAWFTSTTVLPQEREVNRMLDERAKQALVALFAGDEEKADAWLAANVDPTNRMISEQGLVTRATEEREGEDNAEPHPGLEVNPVAGTVSDPPADETPTPPAEATPPETPVVPMIELDEGALDMLTERLVGQITPLIEPLSATLSALGERVEALEQRLSAQADQIEQADQRLAQLQDEAQQRQAELVEDLPPLANKLLVTYRPRVDRASDKQPRNTNADAMADFSSLINQK